MSQPPYAGDQPQKQALVHARIPFDERRGGGGCRRATRGGGNLRRDRLGVFRLPLGQEGLGPLRRDVLAGARLGGDDGRALRVDRGHLGNRIVSSLFGLCLLDRSGRGRLRGGGRARRSRLEPGQQAVPAKQCLYAVLAVTGAEQAAVDEVRQGGHDVVVAATAQRHDLADSPLTVDERQQRPLVAAELRVLGRNGGEAEHRLRRRNRRGDSPPALQPAAGFGDDVLDLAGDADVVRVRLVDGEGELAVRPAQQVENGVDDVLGDQIVQNTLVERAGLLDGTSNTDRVVGRGLVDR